MNFISLLLLCTSLLLNAQQETLLVPQLERVFDINQLHVDELFFPQNFLFGFAIAEQQNSGEQNLPGSNWSEWERTTFADGTPHIINGERSGVACDHWNRYPEDIAMMKRDFNVNSFRFSLAWDRIEPTPGNFDNEALNHYSQEVDALLDAGIIPMITLHHFAHPQWFEDMGAFEKEENIAYFVRFAQTVFSRLGSKVQFWCTINEPSIVVLQGYLRGVFPPGKGNIVTGQPLATKVLRNLMQAHAETYKALKAMPGGPDAQIGLVHQYLKFESYTCWNPLEFMGPLLTNTLLNDTILEFLKTGTFTFGKRFIFNETYTAEGPLTDFIGLNYYSRAVIAAQWPNWSTFEVGGSCYPGEVMTDMPYAIYPKGLYDAIKDVAQIGVPIYITENGIADKNNTNDTRRVQWFREYLKAASLAIEDGFDLRGFFCWTLMDNFEWDMGHDPRFGLYTSDRQIKEGARIYARIINAARAGLLTQPTQDAPRAISAATPALA